MKLIQVKRSGRYLKQFNALHKPIKIEKIILVSLNAPTIGIGALVKAHTTMT